MKAMVERIALSSLLACLAGCVAPFNSTGHGCNAEPGGACATHEDCVIATCASDPCQVTCGLPPAYARSRLQGQDCLVPEGGELPPGCRPSTVDCGPQPRCAAQVGVARCVQGQCITVPLDQADAGT